VGVEVGYEAGGSAYGFSGRAWNDLVQVYREGQRNEFMSFYIEMEEDE